MALLRRSALGPELVASCVGPGLSGTAVIDYPLGERSRTVPSALFARSRLTQLLAVLGWLVAANGPAQAAEPRRDPANKTGISPYRELVARGDKAAVARQLQQARIFYRRAIDAQPEQALAHYRLGQLEVLDGQLEAAEAAYQAARRCAAREPRQLSQILFALADLHERRRALEQAEQTWNAYAELPKGPDRGPIYLETANERVQRLATVRRMIKEYAAVRERIEARVKAADESVKRTSQ